MTRDTRPFNSSFTLYIQSLVMTRYVISFLYTVIKSSAPVLSLFMKHLKTNNISCICHRLCHQSLLYFWENCDHFNRNLELHGFGEW